MIHPGCFDKRAVCPDSTWCVCRLSSNDNAKAKTQKWMATIECPRILISNEIKCNEQVKVDGSLLKVLASGGDEFQVYFWRLTHLHHVTLLSFILIITSYSSFTQNRLGRLSFFEWELNPLTCLSRAAHSRLLIVHLFLFILLKASLLCLCSLSLSLFWICMLHTVGRTALSVNRTTNALLPLFPPLVKPGRRLQGTLFINCNDFPKVCRFHIPSVYVVSHPHLPFPKPLNKYITVPVCFLPSAYRRGTLLIRFEQPQYALNSPSDMVITRECITLSFVLRNSI
jgi:hypothetical protein